MTEEQAEGDGELEAVIEMSEDKQGFRALVRPASSFRFLTLYDATLPRPETAWKARASWPALCYVLVPRTTDPQTSLIAYTCCLYNRPYSVN